MTKAEVQTAWVDRFAGLSRLSAETRDILVSRSTILNVPEGELIFGPGKSPENMLFLLDGTVRVQQVSDTGREIVLYRIHAGESCVLTTACLLAFEDYSAEGIAETPVRAAAVPRKVFDNLVAQSESFRNFVFAAFSKRITGLFQMIDEVAFQRIDVRLAHKLI
ncbi:MAG TPA: Crp/Fnr family transcriptional regulator, partial [Sphingomonadaceae bacterium]|nr:Crp/Fnr family transcriptional regulator [Sphingomonadaceae bacterium]